MNDQLRDLLVRHEGLRLRAYDDATGKDIVPGAPIVGHPTIGIGRALDVNGITESEAMMLLASDVAKSKMEAANYFPWFKDLSEVRQDVIVSMVFNMGIEKFKEFKRMIAFVSFGKFQDAANEMLSSVWAGQVGKRAKELSDMMRTDLWGSSNG